MKRKMAVAVVSSLAVVALFFITGLLIPKQREFVKQAEFNNPPEKVFQVVTDVKNQALWRDDVQKIKVIDSNTWTEVPKKGTPITFQTKQNIKK
ncbi:hypothetical protein IC235_12195 [Hymenobacter sp. BT664]|uniref:Polyketide cyclase n=1 Tax=Hymenobacter montanus TaxID=2771359 RepID=A0A927BEN4_9BACT|nr:hypothetical protein [Hymenobacter montanus]MBD2768647.1 hypothetical protein [Hymenobacter montanus]